MDDFATKRDRVVQLANKVSDRKDDPAAIAIIQALLLVADELHALQQQAQAGE